MMKMGVLGSLRTFVLMLMFIGLSHAAFAQPGDPPPVPISGIEILLLLGGALGIKKILDGRRLKK